MSPIRPCGTACIAATLALLLACVAPAGAVTANGRLQIIHLDVGQGDGALIISPLGQVVLIDEGQGGLSNASGVTVLNQLLALGVTHVDYHFASHYHSDHIGNFTNIVNGGITIGYGWDRGGSYTTATYTNYVAALGNKRRTMVKNQVITLDSLSAHPVFIKCVDLNGAGVSTTDENTLSMVLKVSYGEYDQSFGGDLGGANSGSYRDIESIVGPEMGPIEVYKVHHHGSATSTNDNWLNATTPKLSILSEGNGNSYGHPTAAAVNRLHNHGVKTYWCETGAGAIPNPTWDKVSNGQIAISATWEAGGVDTVRGNGFADTFTNSGAIDGIAPLANLFAPDGGETWKVGSSHAITWTASDNVAVSSVDLAWTGDGGATWTPIATGIGNIGTYFWTAPAPGSPAARVRVIAHDAAGNVAVDSSLATFAIDYWTITASAGPGGTVTPAGVVNVSQGAGRTFAIAPLAGCLITDVVVDGASVGAVTSYPFTGVADYHTLAASFLDVTPPTVQLTSPVGGETWGPSSAHDVTWTASDNLGVDSVSIEYSAAGAPGPWTLVARGLANTGTFAWTLPSATTESALVRVIAYDAALHTASATSDSTFTIGSGSLAVGIDGPARLALAAPMPNPTRGPAQLRFSLPQAGAARIEILDLSGRRVWHAEEWTTAGSHTWTWDGRHAEGRTTETGLYFVRLSTPWGIRTERLIRLK